MLGLSFGAGAVAPFSSSLTPAMLGRLLKMESSAQQGSTVARTHSTVTDGFTEKHPILPVDNTRFIAFNRNSSDHPCVNVADVAIGSTVSVGANSALRSASAAINDIAQNPSNPLQAAVLCDDGYVHLVTVDSSGTGQTTSSHNAAGSISGFIADSSKRGRIVWNSAGTAFIVIGRTSGNQAIFALYTVSGTSLTYVTQATTSSLGNAGTTQLCGAALTGGANNEVVASFPGNSASVVNAARITFTLSAVTIAAESAIATAALNSNTTYWDSVVTLGSMHFWPNNANSATTVEVKLVIDGSSTPSLNKAAGQANRGSGASGYLSASATPVGQFSRIMGALDGSNHYVCLQGIGGSLRSSKAIYSATAGECLVCPSLDFSRALLISKYTTTSTFVGFQIPA